MSDIRFYSEKKVRSLVNSRAGETKMGQVIEVLSNWQDLGDTDATHVLLGIPEDVGVRANYGKPGAAKAWNEGLKTFCNIQVNQYIDSSSVAVLGEVNCEEEMKQAGLTTNVNGLGKLVENIDEKVSVAIQKVVEANKIPIIIGGGHNNSYGNLKGASKGFGTPVNCINFDAHTDYRALEHRHSGNGFSYAQRDAFLEKYFIFGLHRNYTSQDVFDRLTVASETVQFNLFEDISVEKKIPFKKALEEAEEFCEDAPVGIELDMDAIANMGSSAMTPSGFTLEEARQFIRYFSKSGSIYFHICEGSPTAELFPNQVGKTISYLISDIIAR